MPWLIAAAAALLWGLWTLAPWFRRGAATDHRERHGSSVVSIQEITLSNAPSNLAERYFRRLPRFGGWLLWQTRWKESGPSVVFFGIPLIRFGALRRDVDRETLTVARAAFSRHGGTLSFVRAGGRVRIELRGFRPRLFMPLYWHLQLPVHAAMSRAFLCWLSRRPAS